MAPALAGIAAGALAALLSSMALERLVFGVSASDPATLAAVALLACLVPAWRAARIDPAVVLRD